MNLLIGSCLPSSGVGVGVGVLLLLHVPLAISIPVNYAGKGHFCFLSSEQGLQLQVLVLHPQISRKIHLHLKLVTDICQQCRSLFYPFLQR